MAWTLQKSHGSFGTFAGLIESGLRSYWIEEARRGNFGNRVLNMRSAPQKLTNSSDFSLCCGFGEIHPAIDLLILWTVARNAVMAS